MVLGFELNLLELHDVKKEAAHRRIKKNDFITFIGSIFICLQFEFNYLNELLRIAVKKHTLYH